MFKVIMYLWGQFRKQIIILMGIHSSKEKKALEEATKIRQELHFRVGAKKNKFMCQFQKIELNKKLTILLSSATELVDMLDNRSTTSYQLVLCFFERAATVGIENNYIIDEMFDQALVQAKECDDQRQKHPDKKAWKYGLSKEQSFPPFYGVPISVKESFLMKGRQTYAGFVSKINPIPQEQSCFIQLVKGMGFIPFVRTNVPQACKTIQTNNNIFGYAKNPWDPTRSTGGSSGGEGGLIGSYSSPFGVGSDIGGSLRIPSEFNGLCTLKPAQRSITREGNAYYGKYSGGSTVKSQFGAMCRSVQDLILYNEYMFDPKNYEKISHHKHDPYLRLKPLDMRIFAEKPRLKIGIVKRLETLKPSKTHERVLVESEEILQRKGHETVHISLPNFQKLYFFMLQMLTCDQKFGIVEQIRQSEPLIKEYRLLDLFSKIPWIIRKIIIYFIRKKQPRLAKMLELSRPLSVRQIFEMIYQHQNTIARQIFQVFSRNKLDAVVTPGFPTAPPKLGTVGKLQYCLAFNTPWNVIAYPAGLLPVTTVLPNQTTYHDQYEDFYTKNIRATMKEAVGLPIGVQVGSLPQNEQKILYIMKQLEEQFEFRKKHKCPILK